MPQAATNFNEFPPNVDKNLFNLLVVVENLFHLLNSVINENSVVN